jgi:hypothetical protein
MFTNTILTAVVENTASKDTTSIIKNVPRANLVSPVQSLIILEPS